MHTVRNVGALVATALVALLVWVPGAGADLSFCPAGSGAGQCSKPTAKGSAAVDWQTGRLYIADASQGLEGNDRINAFETDGTFVMAFGWGVADGITPALQGCGPGANPPTASCFRGLVGSGTGQFRGQLMIAVDNDDSSPSQGDVYIAEETNFRVQKFDSEGHFLLAFGKGVNTGTGNPDVCTNAGPPTNICGPGTGGSAPGQLDKIKAIGVSSGGRVYVADQRLESGCWKTRVQVFSESGQPVEEIQLPGLPCGNPDGGGTIAGLVVDSAGDFYLSEGVGTRKFDTGGDELCLLNSSLPSTLAVDPDGNLFSAENETNFGMLTRYDGSCQIRQRFAYGELYDSESLIGTGGLAFFHSAAGDVFAIRTGGFSDSSTPAFARYLTLPPAGPFIVLPSVKANPATLSNTKVTLEAAANPNGKATVVHFEYLDQQSFEAQGGFEGPATKSAEVSLGAADFKLQTAKAPIGCPDPLAEVGEGKCLSPSKKYRFRVSATNADGTGNGAVEGQFTTKPSIEVGKTWATDVGTDTAALHGEVNPLGIPASGWFEYVDDAAYREDVEAGGDGFAQATKAPAADEAPLGFGAGESFVTKGVTLYPLPAGVTYHYRLVAEDPLIQLASGEHTFRTFAANEPEPCPANEALRTGPAALLPDCRAYELVSPLDKNNGDIIVLRSYPELMPTVLNQSSVSGGRLAYGTFRAFGDAPSAPYTSQYIASRDEEAGEWTSHGISPPREEGIFNESTFAYFDTDIKALSPDLCQAWVQTTTDPPLSAEGIAGFPNLYRRLDQSCGGESFVAATNAAWQNLPPRAPISFLLELLGTSADGGTAIYVAPDSLAGSGAPNLGGDGKLQLYVWTDGATPAFACVLPNGQALSAPCRAGSVPNSVVRGVRNANVQGAISADAGRVFWTAGDGGPGKIYVREHAEQGQVAGECGEAGKACTIAVSEEAEGLSGTNGSLFFAAARTDGAKAIFTTGGDLYEFEVETRTTTPIAAGVQGLLGVSEDASHVYFVSSQVRGAENGAGAVAQAGKPNLYDFHGGEYDFIGTLSGQDVSAGNSPIASVPTERASRVSPDGLHAAFTSSASLTGYDNTDALSGKADAEAFLYDAAQGELTCVSCNPSGARPASAAKIPVALDIFYAPRVLADDGSRLYFESTDALVARDTNGVQDVYQWEQEGRGGCDAKDVAFSPAAKGCVDLISSGQSVRKSEFVDADPDGSDVFFSTLSSLLPQDYGLVDIYDAREGGGLPAPPPPAPACEGEACQGPISPPNDPTPASSSFEGAGNVIAEPAPSRCRKGKVRRGGRCVAKKRRVAKGKRGRAHKHHRRANHNRGAGR